MKSVKYVLITSFVLATSAYAADPAGTSTASIDPKPSNSGFGVTYFLIGGQTLDKKNELSSVDVFDSYLSFNYKINPDFRISARPSFGYSMEGRNKYGDNVTNKSRVRDFSFVATFNNVLENTLPVMTAYKIAPRLYLPTSDESKDQGLIARLRVENELRWNFAKYSDVRFYALPSYYFQRSTAYLSNSNPKKPNDPKLTNMADLEHGVEISYSLNKMFSLKPALNFIDKWSNSSGANPFLRPYHSSVVDYRLGLEVRATREFGFTVGLQSEQDLIRADKKRELSYSVLTGGTLF